jgi:hypothetical protein
MALKVIIQLEAKKDDLDMASEEIANSFASGRSSSVETITKVTA